jgi:hypothetical protein
MAQEVGLNTDGTAKKCVIIYDYLKLTDTEGLEKNLQEYQMLGFRITSLHNFAARYQIPIICLGQQNRSGLTKDDTGTAAGSDRILWLCSNFTILKMKTTDDVAEDGLDNGNRKLLILACRHGEGLSDGDYINCKLEGKYGRITELKTKFELMNSRAQDDGFITPDIDSDIPFND